MSQRILKILHRDGKKISCIFDGEMFTELSPIKIKKLIEQIKELGNIRKSVAFFTDKLEEQIYNLFIARGICPKIVPSDKDIYITLESLEDVFFKNIDIIALGITDEKLLPTIIALREKKEVLLIVSKVNLKEKFLQYIDYLIVIDEL